VGKAASLVVGSGSAAVSARSLKGEIDDLRIFALALEPDQIKP